MVLLNSSSVQSIDLVYLEESIPKNAFVYFVNKTASAVYFYRGNISNVQNTLAENQIARASIVTSGSSKGIKIDILNNAYSHFEFKIDRFNYITLSTYSKSIIVIKSNIFTQMCYYIYTIIYTCR